MGYELMVWLLLSAGIVIGISLTLITEGLAIWWLYERCKDEGVLPIVE